MNILLIGTTGQLGFELAQSLSPLGNLFSCSHSVLDVTNAAAIRQWAEKTEPDVIVNATAYTAVDKAESESDKAFAVNQQAVENLAMIAAEKNALFVHYSTDYVFDGKKTAAYVESDATAPEGAYGKSKQAGEAAIVRTMQNQGGRAIIFRSSWIFGLHGNNFVKTMLRLGAEREELRVVADQIGCPTPAALVAGVTALVLHRLQHEGTSLAPPAGETRFYHLAGNKAVSWCDFARDILRVAAENGIPLKVDPNRDDVGVVAIGTADYPTPATRPANSRLHCDRLEKDFALQLPDYFPHLRAMIECLAPQIKATAKG